MAKAYVAVTCPLCGAWTSGAPYGKGPRAEHCANWRCKAPLPWPDLPPSQRAAVDAAIAGRQASEPLPSPPATGRAA
jgi:hypothetical protein